MTLSIARVQAWLAAQEGRRPAEIAAKVGVDEKTIRLAPLPDWNPTAKTLRKFEEIIPPDFQCRSSRRKRAA